MTSKKIGVGIVGLSAQGGWASTAHVPALRALSDHYDLVGLSASSGDSARASAEKHGVAFHTDDPAALAARPDVDLVVVTVKVPQHKSLVETALSAGKMVYCEWPLARTLEEAEGLAALAKASGTRAFVGLQARSAPPVRFLGDLIAEGRIGEVLSTSVVASGGPPWGGVASSANAYATDRSTGASMLTIPFGHTIDGLAWTLGDFERIEATLATRRPDVTLSDTGGVARATGPDQVAINGRLSNGAVASMHYRGGASRGTNFLWEINGTKGDIQVTGGIGHLQFGLVRLQAGFGEDKTLSDLPVPDAYRRVPLEPTSMGHTVAHAYRQIVDDLATGTRDVPDFEDAVYLHRLLARIEAQAAA